MEASLHHLLSCFLDARCSSSTQEIAQGRYETKSLFRAFVARALEGPMGGPFHGLPKDVKMRPSSGDDDIFTEPHASGQDEEKKRKRAPSSPGPEKKKPRKKLARKP
ncbi:uncharacterized protein LOC107800342 [Nicotiana tabacum]|uniref:Uncharacterized protein LOC107800342 n=1 Tax=Nicotiana tabacum TaxID=4097 RepID=A0AC58SQ12_TOBAC